MESNALKPIQFNSGLAAELYVASVLADNQCNVLWPMTTQSRYDLVYEDHYGIFVKVQVKRATWSKSGKHKYLQARISGKNKQTNTPYKSHEVDAFAFTDMQRVWLAWFDEVGHMTSVCLDSSNSKYKPQTKYDAKKWIITEESA